MTDQFPTFRRWFDGAARAASAPPHWRVLSTFVERMDRRQPGFFRPSWRQYIAVIGVFACLLVLICLAIPGNPLTVWYWMRLVGPTQEARYGFHVRLDDRDAKCLEVESVRQNGPFDHAGIKVGWRVWAPSCTDVHAGQTLFRELRDVESPQLELRFKTAGCSSREGEIVHRTVAVAQPAGRS
jgi:hypothetical protein